MTHQSPKPKYLSPITQSQERPSSHRPSNIKSTTHSITMGHNIAQSMTKLTNKDNGVPSNVYLLNVAFYSFAIFALGQMFVAISIARSQAMIADSCAMVIDSMTYLFNSWAERIKNRSLNEEERTELSQSEKEMKRLDRTRQRLNLILDLLNVTCFARARHAFGFAVIDEDRHRYMLAYDGSLHNVFADSFNKSQSEVDLHNISEEEDINDTEQKNYSSIAEEREEATKERDGIQDVNLNMCSAYTVRHVFADTLRSTAVLLAAGEISVILCRKMMAISTKGVVKTNLGYRKQYEES
eukprot:scaffold36692_cov65-Cyclotella_meneghiniana.AAC.1